MTWRSVILGLIGSVIISAVCYFNDYVIRQGMLIPHLMPVVVYGSLVFFLLFLNPVLQRYSQRWVLSRKELAIVCCLVLAACSIPSWGLVQCLPTSIMMPHHYYRLRPGWQQQNVLETAPLRMLVDTSINEDETLNGYVAGLGEGTQHIGLRDVPWYAWWKTLAFWVPLMISALGALFGVAVVVHKQWVHHEQLPYPISIFAHSLLPGKGAGRGKVFNSRLFWLGALGVFAIQFNNYLCQYWPENLIPVRLYLDFTPLSTMFPTLIRGTGMALLRPRIYFAVIGLAYFIASDVSFSMGTIPFFFCFIQGWLAGYGIMLRTGDHLSVKLEAFLFTGGYLGILLMAVYTGRHYYWSVTRKACGLKAHDNVEGHVAWGMRVFVLGTMLFIAQLIAVGLDWQLAVLYTCLALMIWIVVSRTIAETGAFHIGSEIFPGAIIMGVFGATALGPTSLIIMYLVSAVILAAPGWSPMPFLVQGLKLADMSNVHMKKMLKWTMLALLISLAVAIPVTIYWQYDQGAPSSGWPRMLSAFPFENIVTTKHKLAAQGTLELSAALSGWQRFTHMLPNGPCLVAFAIALVTALGLGFARLRFTRWPIHPVVFVFLCGHQAKVMSGSFLLGWLIKTLVNKYGGAKLYHTLKPLMIGVIAGEMSARLVPMVVGTIIYAVTGQSPR